MEFDWTWLFILVPAVVIASFAVLVVVVGLWEKHPVQPFAVPEKGKNPPETDYARRANDAAEDVGFDHRGVAADSRGGMYSLRFDFWASSDQTVYAVIVGGKLVRIHYKGTVIFSPLPDGRYLATTDDVGMTDLSGLSELHIWPNKAFHQLYNRHLDRLEDLVGEPLPFEEEDPIRAYLAVRAGMAERMVRRGLGKYVDDERTAWRYTLRGAVKHYVVGVWLQPFGRLARTLGLSM